jgi:hypothetical protein
MPTSSANPFKLRQYSTDGLAMVAALRPHATAVAGAVGTLTASGNRHLPALGDAHTRFADLVDDWYHLDEFVGDVAHGFFQANSGLTDTPLTPEQMAGMVLSLDDGQLARQGQVGYADRDVAIAAADAMADELERLRREGATPEDIQRFVGMAGRGQYDPAFAVTFSERVGPEGYAHAAAMVQAAYSVGGNLIPDGIAAVGILSMVLTTALDTRANIPDHERHDPSTRGLPDDQRIDEGFVNALVRDYHPGGTGGTWYNGPSEHDLSVVLRFADPPTDVAIDIAQHRMTPRLDDYGPNASGWGEYGDPVVNYATMLGRNDDASAGWLAIDGNIEAVLNRPGDHSLDGGTALADVVEQGVTHMDPAQRRPLMDRAIDAVGANEGEFPSDDMRRALAAGVEANMDLIAERGTRVTGGAASEGSAGDTVQNTHHFLVGLLSEDDTAAQVYAATLDYVHDQIAAGVASGEGFGHQNRVIGTVLGLVMEADIDIAAADAEETAGRRQAFLDGLGSAIESAIGLAPGGGTVTTLAQDGLGFGVDNLLSRFEDTSSADLALQDASHYRKEVQDLVTGALAGRDHATGDVTSAQVVAEAEEAGATGDTDFFADGTTGDKRPIKPVSQMSAEERAAYRRWLSSEGVNNRIAGDRDQVAQAIDDVQDLTADLG